MSTVLHQLASLYRKSKAGKGQAQSEFFLIDYEKFLRFAKWDDGDEREWAEAELAVTAAQSGGLLVIDRHRRSHEPERIRLAIPQGEVWLFERIQECSPSQQRSELAGFFKSVSRVDDIPHLWESSWFDYFQKLATKALEGRSVLPFKREQATYNQELLQALTGVIAWRDESLIRYASAVICGQSKRLGDLESALVAVLEAITGEPTLESFGILHKPRSVTLHGPLKLCLNGEVVDFSHLPGPISISESNLTQSSEVSCADASFCLSVENEDVFHELAKRNPGVLLILTSYPGSAVRCLYARLPERVRCYHFGDSDPSGFDILRDLREKTKRPVQAFLMDYQPASPAVPLSSHDQQLLRSLLADSQLSDLHTTLQDIEQSRDKGKFEQEHIEIEKVIDMLVSELVKSK